jgi:Oxygenase, catalysing oxidative methylation of damaged DNA
MRRANCLQQNLYGDLVFPLQLTVLLKRPTAPGGEFLLVEQLPRAPVKGRGRAIAAGRGYHLPGPQPAGRGYVRALSGDDAPRCQSPSLGAALHPRDHLSRRGVRSADALVHIARHRSSLPNRSCVRQNSAAPARFERG